MSSSQGTIQTLKNSLFILLGLLSLGVCLLSPAIARADVVSGYQEYYIPGSTDQMWAIFDDINPNAAMVTTAGMHEVIGVTASLQSTTVYYDHWEDGYDFNPKVREL
jgi:hypothetical protein